jgi:aminodeoxyfutalosine deaminase
MNSLERVILTADVVYNGVGLPLTDAGVVVSGSGETQTVVSFGKLEALRTQFPELQTERVGRAILPRAVNAHTHLDMTRFPFTALPYFDWIPQVAVANAALRGADGARVGLARLRDSGIGAFGDIVAREDAMDMLLNESDLRGVAYWEVLGADPTRADDLFADTVHRVNAWRKLEGAVRVGLTPHTPHTVSAKLLKRSVDFARLEGLPVQIHVAEHPSELELFRTGEGALARSLQAFKLPPFEVSWGRAPDPELTPVKYLAEIGVLEARPTLVHAVNVTDEDVRIIAQFGCPVVTCPRSNRHLHCGTFPWALYARHGVEVALGTDSIASGETLEIHDEALAAVDLLGVDLRQVVRWAVKGGYKALGMKPPVVARGDDFSRLTVWA